MLLGYGVALFFFSPEDRLWHSRPDDKHEFCYKYSKHDDMGYWYGLLWLKAHAVSHLPHRPQQLDSLGDDTS